MAHTSTLPSTNKLDREVQKRFSSSVTLRSVPLWFYMFFRLRQKIIRKFIIENKLYQIIRRNSIYYGGYVVHF